MGTCLRLFSTLIAASMLVGSVSAEEQKLKFRVVMTEVSGSMNDITAFKGHAMGAQKFAGAAVFEDGRIAYKSVVALMDIADEKVSYSGYSTYMFQNGDVLVVKFTGGGSPSTATAETMKWFLERVPIKARPGQAASIRSKTHGKMPTCSKEQSRSSLRAARTADHRQLTAPTPPRRHPAAPTW